MTKQVTDPNTGKEISVPLNTPCHAGQNGALPVMLDEILDADIFTDMEDKEAAAIIEKEDYIANQKPIDERNKARGDWRVQMEYLIDNGIAALVARDDAIKLTYPKS